MFDGARTCHLGVGRKAFSVGRSHKPICEFVLSRAFSAGPTALVLKGVWELWSPVLGVKAGCSVIPCISKSASLLLLVRSKGEGNLCNSGSELL